MVYQIGWFSTGRDLAARDLLKTVWGSLERGEIRAEIPFVFCNREPGESRESDLFSDLVRGYNIPFLYLSSKRFASERGVGFPSVRLEYDREVMELLKGFHPDLCVLAGYMLIVGEEMCQRYEMINLHPAAPGGPTGTWQEVIRKLMETGAKETGVMMHLVTKELDMGPPVTYCTFPIAGEPFDRYRKNVKGVSLERLRAEQGESNPLFRLIRKQGLAREFPLIRATLKAFSEGRVKIEGGKVLDSLGNPTLGYCLSEEIEEIIKKGA